MVPRVQSPVLILAYKRPESFGKVLQSVISSGRSKIYVACDGPRTPLEESAQAVIRKIIKNQGHSAEIRSRFSETHLGVRSGVHSGIDWFFSHESQGMILEDDTVPSPDFFTFCELALSAYADHRQVQQISGHNPLGNFVVRQGGRWFSPVSSRMDVWGWATWKDRWEQYRASRDEQECPSLDPKLVPETIIMELEAGMAGVIAGKIDSWAYTWAWHALINRRIAIVASSNTVTNIGFSQLASHTKHGRDVDQKPLRPNVLLPENPSPSYGFDEKIAKSVARSLVRARRTKRQKQRTIWLRQSLSLPNIARLLGRNAR